MHNDAHSNSARRRLPQWSNPEFIQAVMRLVFVGGAIAYAFSDYCLAHSPSLRNVLLSRWVSVMAGAAAALICLWTVRLPAPSVARRLTGITHDTSPYWQSNPTLSFYIAAILVVVPGYTYALLNSLHKARAELEQRATHDHLTGLMNRAGIEQRILETVSDTPQGHVLLYMDLDQFKHVNDNAGHAAGDHLLREIARVIRLNVRENDLCARLGGDEFCVLFSHCSMDTAAQIAERIREQVHRYRLLWGGRVYSVGTSIGVAASDSVQDGPSLLRLADAACYAAKNEGRNSVHVVGAHQRITDTGLLRRLRATD